VIARQVFSEARKMAPAAKGGPPSSDLLCPSYKFMILFHLTSVFAQSARLGAPPHPFTDPIRVEPRVWGFENIRLCGSFGSSGRKILGKRRKKLKEV